MADHNAESAVLRHRDRQVVDHDNLTKVRTPAEAIQAALVIGQTALNFAPRTLHETQLALARVCAVLEHSTTARGPRSLYGPLNQPRTSPGSATS